MTLGGLGIYKSPQAPEEMANPEVTRADPHALKLARLQWELERRKALSGAAEAREGERDGLELGIRQREERLRELQPQLRAVLASTQPVQEYLALPLDTRREQAGLAKLLPAPLYICYTQVAAFAEACDTRVEVAVKGEEEEARRWREDKQEEEEEGEEEVVEQESQEEEGEKSRSKSKSVAKAGARRAALIATHPLTVEVVVRGEGELSLVVTLHHLPTLGLVTVRSAVVGEVRGAGEVLDPSTMLAHLFPGDCGLVLPPAHSLRWAGDTPLHTCTPAPPPVYLHTCTPACTFAHLHLCTPAPLHTCNSACIPTHLHSCLHL